jgi:hypothetical protein
MAQKYYADAKNTTVYRNGSMLYRTHMPFSSVAKVVACPCEDGKTRTVYATSEPDTFFSIPAQTRITHGWRQQHTVTGFLTLDEDGWQFIANKYGKNGSLLKKL